MSDELTEGQTPKSERKAANGYNAMKNNELEELIKKYELDPEDYHQKNGGLNRIKLINILKLIDVQTGKSKEAVAIDADGNVGTHNPRKRMGKSFSGMMVKLTFYSSDEGDLPYVQLGLNGLALVIPREVPVWIPKEFVDGVMATSIVTKMRMEVQENGKIVYIPKQVPRFQHTVHDIKHIDELKREYDEANAKEKARHNN